MIYDKSICPQVRICKQSAKNQCTLKSTLIHFTFCSCTTQNKSGMSEVDGNLVHNSSRALQEISTQISCVSPSIASTKLCKFVKLMQNMKWRLFDKMVITRAKFQHPFLIKW